MQLRVGNRVIFNQDGDILYQTGEIEGTLERKEITSLSHIDFELGEIDYHRFRILKIDLETMQPVLEEIIREETLDEKIQELENELLLITDRNNGGIL